MICRIRLWLIAGFLAGAGACLRAEETVPISVSAGLFDLKNERTLGLEELPGARSFTVFRPEADGNHYNHGAVPVVFRGRLWVQWQSSARDEDAADTRVMFAVSDDMGERWERPQVLAAPRDGAVVTNGGWVTDGERLVAFLNIWPQGQDPRGGHLEWTETTDGKTWSEPQRATMKDGSSFMGVMEQDLRQAGGGRLVSAAHFQPGLHVAPCHTRDPLGKSGWVRAAMPGAEDLGATSRAMEPGWFVRRDGSLVMTFRDQKGSFRVMAAESSDGGKTWSAPVVTSLPDSRSKQSAGNLPDGTAFLVNNPTGCKRRSPLVMSLSKDGRHFDRAYLLRTLGEDVETMRREGRYKRDGFSYPKCHVSDSFIIVACAVHKERIEITRVPVAALER
ncbi:MAG: exo-alpha-sialidase [Akkermansiaceae bacterium]|nr:exo-alpha-sialidase [Akkermansiaceae bacterium]